jgi:uncharacterized membrane protein
MGNALRFLYLLSLVAWVGGVIFFSFVGAPSTFQAVPVDVAGKVVAKIFPRYYLLGFVAGLVALVSFLGLARVSGKWDALRVANVVLLTAMLGAGLYAGTVVRRQANEVRQQIGSFEDLSQARPELRAEFDRLHRLSVVLNGVVLVLGVVVLFLTATQLRL